MSAQASLESREKKLRASLKSGALSLLRAPGQGLLTVTTGSGEAEKVIKPLLGKEAWGDWPETVKVHLKAPGPFVLGFPSDAGGGICRGAAHGPLRLRAELYKNYPRWAAHELGDLPCIPQLLEDSMLSRSQKEKSGKALWGRRWKTADPVAPLSLLKKALQEALEARREELRPLIVGGDHSTSWAVSEALHKSKMMTGLGVLHFDAHTDLMEDRYGVSPCFATWSAACSHRLRENEVGLKLKGADKNMRFVQVGLRVSGRPQSYWEKKYKLRQYWTKELSKFSAEDFVAQISAAWKRIGIRSFYTSFDVDALDPKFVPSTGTPEGDGLDPTWCVQVIRGLAREFPLIASDIVELAPVLHSASASAKSTRHSARIARTLLECMELSYCKSK